MVNAAGQYYAARQSNLMRVNKHQMKLVDKAERQYKDLLYENMRRYMPSVVIAMYENSSVRWPGVERWRKNIMDIIEYCSERDERSIFEELDKATGLEIQINGRSYKETAFANENIFKTNMCDGNPMKWIRFYQQKATWTPSTICCLCMYACHKQFNWSAEGMLSKILNATNEIVDYYEGNTHQIADEFRRITGHEPDELWRM